MDHYLRIKNAYTQAQIGTGQGERTLTIVFCVMINKRSHDFLKLHIKHTITSIDDNQTLKYTYYTYVYKSKRSGQFKIINALPYGYSPSGKTVVEESLFTSVIKPEVKLHDLIHKTLTNTKEERYRETLEQLFPKVTYQGVITQHLFSRTYSVSIDPKEHKP